MDNFEVILRLRDHMRVHKMSEPQAYYINEAHEIAIKALKLQIPVAPVLNKERSQRSTIMGWYDCPRCGNAWHLSKYCRECGQALKEM